MLDFSSHLFQVRHFPSVFSIGFFILFFTSVFSSYFLPLFFHPIFYLGFFILFFTSVLHPIFSMRILPRFYIPFFPRHPQHNSRDTQRDGQKQLIKIYHILPVFLKPVFPIYINTETRYRETS